MTSAPMSPRIWVQNGPATFWVRSTTTTRSSGRPDTGQFNMGGSGAAPPPSPPTTLINARRRAIRARLSIDRLGDAVHLHRGALALDLLHAHEHAVELVLHLLVDDVVDEDLVGVPLRQVLEPGREVD